MTQGFKYFEDHFLQGRVFLNYKIISTKYEYLFEYFQSKSCGLVLFFTLSLLVKSSLSHRYEHRLQCLQFVLRLVIIWLFNKFVLIKYLKCSLSIGSLLDKWFLDSFVYVPQASLNILQFISDEQVILLKFDHIIRIK